MERGETLQFLLKINLCVVCSLQYCSVGSLVTQSYSQLSGGKADVQNHGD